MSWRSRWLTLQIFVLLPLIVVILKLIGFKPLYGLLAILAPIPSGANVWRSSNSLTDALLVGRLVVKVANNLPYTAVCLPRSLVLWWVLRRKGIGSTLRIGVRKVSNRFEAHAWVEFDGVVINDSPNIQKSFAPFDSSIFTSLESPG